MKAFLPVAGAALILLSCASASAQPSDPVPSIDAIFERWSNPASPGCAVGVAQDGVPTLLRAYGSSDLEHDIPNRPETVFEAGSVSKQFTAAAVLLLAQDGKLSLDDDVRRFIPELPDYGATITIDHLLAHTSGLRDWGEIALRASWPRTSRIYTMADVLDIAARQKSLNYSPGTEYSYTNTGYVLLALIVERVSGVSFPQFTHDRLFAPMGMRNSQWRDDFRRIVKDRAVAYARGKNGFHQEMPFENAFGNGGLLTTVGDLLLWNKGLAEGRLGAFITTELQKRSRLNDGREINYARGLMINQYRRSTEIAHTGATAGYRAWLGRYPERKLSIALLCNTADANPMAIAHAVADAFLPAGVQAASAPRKVNAEAVARRAGIYLNEHSGEILRLAANGSMLRIKGGPAVIPTGENSFVFLGNRIEFKGEGRFQLWRPIDGARFQFRRLEPYAPSQGQLAEYAGSFASVEADVSYITRIEGSRLTLVARNHPASARTLLPVDRDAFEIEDGVIRFRRDDHGAVIGFSMIGPRVRDLRFHRAE